MEDRETITPSNPLRTVLDEMGKRTPDVGQLGESLFDLSMVLIPTLAVHIEHERSTWRRETGEGKIKAGLVGQSEVYQQAFLALASLGKPGGQRDFQFYLPDSGISRLSFTIDDNGQLLVEATYNSTPEVKEKFKGLYQEVKQSRSAAPSGLWGRLKSFVRR